MPDHSALGRFRAYAPGGPRGPEPKGASWEALMALALKEAKLAGAAGDVPVGAILVNARGNLIAKAGNRVERDNNPCAHAEILTLAAGAARLRSPRLLGCILLATLEPCLMCAAAIAQSRVDGVVFGAADCKAGCLVSLADACSLPLAGRRFWHLGGIRSQECAELLRDFFGKRRNNRNVECSN